MSDNPRSRIPADKASLAYATLTSAYRADPVHRWLYPDDDSYTAKLPQLIAAIAESAFESGTAWRLEDEDAVALWVAPGAEPDAERIGRVLFETVPVEKHPEMFGTLEQTDAARPPYPHWYLPFFGVENSKQGQGLGSRLLAASLDYIDVGGLPAYLLAPNPRNVAFLERYGFVVQSQAQEGTAPALTVMVREGRHG
jgi:GNAT superfamily N-acetyltransferase